MKKILTIVAFVIICGFSICSMSTKTDEKTNEKKYCENLLNIQIPKDSNVLKEQDTHGGEIS